MSFITTIVFRIVDKMDLSSILSIIHTVTFGTKLKNNGGNSRQWLNNVTWYHWRPILYHICLVSWGPFIFSLIVDRSFFWSFLLVAFAPTSAWCEWALTLRWIETITYQRPWVWCQTDLVGWPPSSNTWVYAWSVELSLHVVCCCRFVRRLWIL